MGAKVKIKSLLGLIYKNITCLWNLSTLFQILQILITLNSFSGTTYNFVMNSFDMSESTRAFYKQYFDILYAPTNLAKNIGGAIRAIGASLGFRLLTSLIFTPVEMIDELRSITIDEVRKQYLSTAWQNIFLVRFWYQIIWVLLGASILFVIGDATREDRPRKKRGFFVQDHQMNMDVFFRDLNARIEAYDSPCFEM